MKKTPDIYRAVLIYMFLVIATFIAFKQVHQNDFVYDDGLYITNNPYISGGITHESIFWAFTSLRAGNWHPLTWLSHMLDCQFFGLNPSGHHITNLLFHIANTLLLFGVLKKMTGAIWRSVFVAAAFALHPLHVESVAWVAERKDVLSGFFWMLTIAAYVRYVKQPSIKDYLPVVLAFCLGLMAKPMLVTLPFVLLLLDYWPLGRLRYGSQALPQSESAGVGCHKLPVSHLILEKIPLFILALASGLMTYIAQQSTRAVIELEKLPITFRIANALISYVSYLGKMIYPNHLAVFYPLKSLKYWHIIVSFIILLFISRVVKDMARRRPYLAVGWLYYLGTLVPVIGLVQVGTQAMADRYTYLPSIGIFIMVAWGVSDLVAKWRLRKIVLWISAGLLLATMLICTRMQIRHWQNNFTLYGHAIAVTENNYKMYYNYGIELGKNGQLDEAIKHLNEAVRIFPGYLNAHYNLGAMSLEQGKYNQAIKHFNEALRIDPNFTLAQEGLKRSIFFKGDIQRR